MSAESNDFFTEKKKSSKSVFNPSFKFDFSDSLLTWNFQTARKMIDKPEKESVDTKIARLQENKQNNKKKTKSKKSEDEDEDSEEESDAQDSGEEEAEDEESTEKKQNTDEDENIFEENEQSQQEEEKEEEEVEEEEEDEDEEEDREEEEEKEDNQEIKDTFDDMNLSRPLLKSVHLMGFIHPTPIQKKCIPLALMGKDLQASAMTGSGKTAAFVLPVLERLLYREKRSPTIRVLILLPTRELAVQCHSVIENLAKFTDITACLAVGGLSNKAQEAILKTLPDIVVATPGRIIDHLRNSQSFNLNSIEILILDEADRLLDMGFADELKEIIKSCPVKRQTLLFSATMTKNVEKLVNLSLKDPLRISVDALYNTAQTLTQEFIRIKEGKEAYKEAILLALCTSTLKTRTLIFFREKRVAHRVKVLFGLSSLNAAELHGNLTQLQRLDALERFRDGTTDFLLATDLAARGLDILGIENVVNFDMPTEMTKYVHRVGRTARAGKRGRSISFITKADRPLLKMIVKKSAAAIKQRVVDSKEVLQWKKKIDELQGDIKEILKQEEEEKEIRTAEIQAERIQNMLIHKDEIQQRPAKTWFQTTSEKKESKERQREEFLAKSKLNGEKADGMEEDPLAGTGGGEEEGQGQGQSNKKRKRKEKIKESKETAKERFEKLKEKVARMPRKKRRNLIARELDENDREFARKLKQQSAAAKAFKSSKKLQKLNTVAPPKKKITKEKKIKEKVPKKEKSDVKHTPSKKGKDAADVKPRAHKRPVKAKTKSRYKRK